MLQENCGHYKVDNNVFNNKIEAILHASQNGGELSWNYCDELFTKYDWSIEPELPVDEYYRLRAQQIRDNYDYVVIRCSGGADSTNVLYSFLNNKIWPDEVIGESPLSGLSNWNVNNKDTRMINTVSEFKYAQLPLLDHVKFNYPHIKVTHIDSFNRIVNPNSYSWLINCNDGIDAHASFEGTMWENSYLLKLAENGKRIAIVTGTDKPYVTADIHGNVYTHFVDLPLNYLKRPFKDPYPNVHRVTFYWTPDFPQCAAKMSHIIARKLFGKQRDHILYAAMIAKNNVNIPASSYYSSNEILDSLLRPVSKSYYIERNLSYNPNNVYGRGVCKYIYPSTYDSTVFQAEKQNKNQTFFGAQQDWIRILHPNMGALDMIHSEFKTVYNKISPKFLNEYGTGFKYYTKSYKLGTTTFYNSTM